MAGSNPRIIYITAGAAGMYCGSCLRDNALVAALARSGCDVQLVPVYTPIRTDEQDVSVDHLFFGGINVYLQEKSSTFRRLPRFLDAALNLPWLVRKVSSRNIETDARELGAMTLSMLKGEEGNQRKEVLRLVDWLRSETKPDLLNLTNALIAGFVPALKREMDIPVLVTLQGDDLFLDFLPEPDRTRVLEQLRKVVERVDGFLTFSRFYSDYMADLLKIPSARIHQVPLGVSAGDFRTERPSRSSETGLNLGYLARVCPEKGFHLLIDAFLLLKRQPGMESVRLLTAGWLSRQDVPFLDEQKEKIVRAGLERDFEYRGVLDRKEKIRFLSEIDLFSVPAVYHEPKGMYVLEALASGVPVVQPKHGIFPEMLEKTGGGVIVDPEDPGALAKSIRDLLTDPGRREKLARAGREKVAQAFDTSTMAEQTLRVYREYLKG